jgi:hypothetical protein
MELCTEDHADIAVDHALADDLGEAAVDEYPLIRIIVAAIGCRPPRTKAVRSIFDIGTAGNGLDLLSMGRRFAVPPSAPDEAPGARIVRCLREPGTTRCVGALYPVRWTPEQEEQEAQRRARQRPPRPTKGARTKSKKLRDMVGTDDW